MSRIIPGVEVKVVKEVVPQQLAPSGVLGLIGFIDKNKEKNEIIRAGSWNSFISECGVGSSNSLPEARQALQNGVYELVISPLVTKEENIAKAEIASGLIVEARCGGTLHSVERSILTNNNRIFYMGTINIIIKGEYDLWMSIGELEKVGKIEDIQYEYDVLKSK